MKKIYGLIIILWFAASCKTDNKKTNVAETKTELTFPAFNKDSAYQFVRQQINFGPRIPNSPAHEKCADWFVEKFESYGAVVIVQKFQAKAFDGIMLNGKNIIAQLNPTIKRRLIFAAHWDTRPWADSDPDPANHKKTFDSADDGPSGVAVLLELARVLQSQPVKGIGIDFVLFDLEDYGQENNNDSWALGSKYWSGNLHSPGYRAQYGVLLDMVGASNPGFYIEDYSMMYAKDVVEKVWNLAESEGYGGSFPKRSGGGVMDDHYYVNEIAKIPMIDIINRPDGKKFPFYHHTMKDNMNVIDPYTLQMVGRLLVKLIYREEAGTI